jgi:ABC-2 type transport system permease protein
MAAGATTMLAYKAWRESRTRFAAAAVVVVGSTLALVLFQAELRRRMGYTSGPAATYVGYVYVRVYGGVVRSLFLMLAAILGLGGLHREHARHTLWFTLALPVRRGRHLFARAAVGFVEIVVLALVPAVLVPLGSRLVGQRYPWSQSLTFAVLWIAFGALVFAASLVWSVLVKSEYVALALSLLALRMEPLVVAKISFLNRLPLQIHDLMNGRGTAYFDPQRDVLVGGVPWSVTLGALTVALLLVAIATRWSVRERFS